LAVLLGPDGVDRVLQRLILKGGAAFGTSATRAMS
jgi:hypothetical protein